MPSRSSRKSKRSDYSSSSTTSRRRHYTSSSSSSRNSSNSLTGSIKTITSTALKPSFTNNRLLNLTICTLAFCLMNTANFRSFLHQNGEYYLRSRRYLLGPPKLSEAQLMQSRSHLLFPVDYMPEETETTVAWFDQDAPPLDGDVMLKLHQCMGENVAVHSRHGVGDLARFQLYNGDTRKMLDMSNFRDVMASQGDLLVLTNEPYDTVNQLFDKNNRGRMFALFDNPVHRTIQRFMDRSEGAEISLLNWVKSADNSQDNMFVKKLLGKHPSENVNLVDLQMAKEFIRQSVVVGLTSEMQESFSRFNVAMGVNESRRRYNAKCLNAIFRKNKVDTDKFVKLVPSNSRAWNFIAKKNYLDMALYAYIEKLFEEYDGVFNLFPQDLEEDDPSVIEESSAASEGSRVDIRNDFVEQQTDVAEQQSNTQESAEKLEDRIIKDSPYADHDEDPAPATEEAGPAAMQRHNRTDSKAGLKRHLADVSSFEFGNDKPATPFFWHVPKAGGTAVQNLYWCMGLTLANEVGGNPKLLERKKVPRNKLSVFQPWKESGNIAKIINVDVTSHKGIENAIKLGFLTKEGQPKTDFVSSSLFHVVSMKLFSKNQKARMFALFRHPVERAVSKFYYLAKATWEPTYDETWANMTLEEWATNDRGENNWLVHHLSGKKHFETVDRRDLEAAKELIQSKFIVGLMNQFGESVHRFNLLLGVDENDSNNKQCLSEFAQGDDSRKAKKRDLSNRNSYTKAQEGSKAWNMIADINSLDVELFSFIEEQFLMQKKLFEQYESQRVIFDQLQAQQRVKTN